MNIFWAILIILVCSLNCTSTMPQRPTIGQELCASGCKMLGGKYVSMSEAERKCYCEFQMPERLTMPQTAAGPGGGTSSSYGTN